MEDVYLEGGLYWDRFVKQKPYKSGRNSLVPN